MGFVMTSTNASANLTNAAFAKDQGRSTHVDVQMLLKDSAIATATCWMNAVFVEAAASPRAIAIALETSLTSAECAEAWEFLRENAIAMATSWMSVVYAEVTAVRSMNAGCAMETTHPARVAPMSLPATMTRQPQSWMSVLVNLECVEAARN